MVPCLSSCAGLMLIAPVAREQTAAWCIAHADQCTPVQQVAAQYLRNPKWPCDDGSTSYLL